MLQSALLTYLEISLITGLLIVFVKFFSKKLNKNFDTRWKYWGWLALALRLLIPLGIPISKAPIKVTLPVQQMTFANQAIITQANANQAVTNQADTAAIATNLGNEVKDETVHNAIPSNDTLVAESSAASIDSEEKRTDQQNNISIITLLIAGWLTGCVAFLGWQLLCYHLHRKRLLRWSMPLQNEDILAQVAMERYILGIHRQVEVLTCRNIQSPTIVGFIKPKLLLPAAIQVLTHTETIFVLRHELIHLKRNDLWYKLLLVCATSAHWFNPAAHLLLKEASADLEISCDAQVIKGGDAKTRQAYTQTILAFVARENHSVMLSTHFNGGAKAMKERFTTLLRTSSKRKGIAAFLTLLIVTVMAGSLIAAPLAEQVDELGQLIQSWKAQYEGTGQWEPNMDVDYAPKPEETDLQQEEVLRLAMETIMKANSKDVSMFEGYGPYFDFNVFEDGRHEWSVGIQDTKSPFTLDPYFVLIDSLTGKVLFYQFGGRG